MKKEPKIKLKRMIFLLIHEFKIRTEKITLYLFLANFQKFLKSIHFCQFCGYNKSLKNTSKIGLFTYLSDIYNFYLSNECSLHGAWQMSLCFILANYYSFGYENSLFGFFLNHNCYYLGSADNRERYISSHHYNSCNPHMDLPSHFHRFNFRNKAIYGLVLLFLEDGCF